jgi:hypothetical protein
LFAKNYCYNDKRIQNLGISQYELRDYADLGLGKQIRGCVKEQGYCCFEA